MSGRHFGFECELIGGTPEVLSHLYDASLLRSNRLHSYHCSCLDCDPVHGGPLHAQSDCTVQGEIISKILQHGTPEADQVITGLAGALRAGRAVIGTAGGFHVHVDRQDLDAVQHHDVWRLYMRYQTDLAELASCSFDNVRNYNQPYNSVDAFNSFDWPETGRPGREFWTVTDDDLLLGRYRQLFGSRSNWLCATDYGTFEFRLWNATLAEWRMRLAVGMSVAIVDAAADGVRVDMLDRRPLEEVVGPYMDDDTWAGVLRQRHAKGVALAS